MLRTTSIREHKEGVEVAAERAVGVVVRGEGVLVAEERVVLRAAVWEEAVEAEPRVAPTWVTRAV
jgi:hypothetical protein